MSKRYNQLSQLRVASPCPASWDDMAGDERTRFCGQCKLNVYNISDMTAPDAEAFLMEATGRTCVRYFERADGTVMTRDCPVGLAKLRKRAAVGLTAFAGLFLMMASVFAFGSKGEDGSLAQPYVKMKEKAREIEPFKTILNSLDPPPPPPPVAYTGKMVVGALAAPRPTIGVRGP